MLTLPLWILEILLEQMPALEAEEIERLAMAASTPFMADDARRRFLDRLDALARPRSRPTVSVIEHNPDKAAEYFRSLGADVVQS